MGTDSGPGPRQGRSVIISDDWGRIAAFAVDDEHEAGAVWIAGDGNKLVVFDSCLFGDLPLERVAQGINARGRGIVAWEESSRTVADTLLYEHGVNMDPHGVSEDEAMAAMLSRDLASLLASGLLTVGERETQWRDEYAAWRRSGEFVAGSPLLKATRLALARRSYIKPSGSMTSKTINYPKMSVV